jgi:hypothetical protein
MTQAKISIFRICSDQDALEVRRNEIQAVLDGEEGVFSEEEQMQAEHEEHALTECVHLIAESITASLEWNWKEAGCLLNRAYRRNGEEPPITSPIQAGYALHRGVHPVQVQAG